MNLTPEQAQAQRMLQDAVDKHAEAFRGTSPQAEVVTDWVLVACTVSYDENGQRAGYNMAYSNGELPEHVVVGLCEVGKNIAQGTYIRDEE